MTRDENRTRLALSDPERGRTNPTVTIVMLAWNEADVIARTVASLARQTVWTSGFSPNLIIYCNGCTDRTAEVARNAITACLPPDALNATRIVETDIADKSRAWNAVVHEVANPSTDYFLFLDADIVFASDDACLSILTLLKEDPYCVAVTGHPVKSLALKQNKTILDRLSLRVSEHNRAPRSINGQLYCIFAQEARKIHLPTRSSGEDGFLNAMVYTDGFTAEPDAKRVNQADTVTHYYEPASGMGIFYHERRVTIGTIINRWIFEHLWDQQSKFNIGRSIAEWNIRDPKWVENVVSRHVGNKRWVVPTAMLFWRMPDRKTLPSSKYVSRLPVSIAATAFTILVCWAANRRLKSGSAIGIW